MIYADDTCLAEGALGNAQVPMDSPPLPSLEAYRAHWRYAEDDAAYRALRWGAYAVWDDHEIVNDAGPHHDHVRRGRGQHVSLLPIGRRGLLEHDAIDLPPDDTSTPLHRRFRWGRHLELVLLDTRSHRDDDGAPDDGPEPKTMLGRTQRAWLADLLRSSDASWIVIVSSVPIALPTGANGRRDSWASGDTDRGFVRELRGLFEVARRAGRRELVFLTTDVHFTAAFEHHPFDDDPGFVVHELVTGPLSAGLFPFDEFDTTLGTERVLHHVPEGAVHTLEAARPYFTWGKVEIDREDTLTLSARNADEELWRASLVRGEMRR
jgi:alkaline phosphatase D